MSDNPENTGQMMMLLGELRGQVRELVHSINNLRQDVGTVFDRTANTQGMISAIAEIKADAAAIEVRVTALEATENQRKGAVRLTEWAIRVVPFAALGAGFAFMAKMVGL